MAEGRLWYRGGFASAIERQLELERLLIDTPFEESGLTHERWEELYREFQFVNRYLAQAPELTKYEIKRRPEWYRREQPKIETIGEARGNPGHNPGTKEPWQMTQAEFVAIYEQKHREHIGKRLSSLLTKEELQAVRDEAIDYQAHTIRQALAVSKPIPPEVLADYPELAPKAATSSGGNPGAEIVQRQYTTPAGAVVEFGIREGDNVFLSRATATAPSGVSDMAKGWEIVPEDVLANYKGWLGKSGKWGSRAAEIEYLQKHAESVIQRGHEKLAQQESWKIERERIDANLASAASRGYGLRFEDLKVGDEIEWAGDGSRYIVTEFDETGHVYARPIEETGQAGGSINLAEYKLVRGNPGHSPGNPGVTPKMTGDIWDRMTPIERERLGIKAKLDAERRSTFWIELWPAEKRAIISAYKKEARAEHHSWSTARALGAAAAGVITGLVGSVVVPIIGLAGGILAQAAEKQSPQLRKAQYITAGVVDGSAALLAKSLFTSIQARPMKLSDEELDRRIKEFEAEHPEPKKRKAKPSPPSSMTQFVTSIEKELERAEQEKRQ